MTDINERLDELRACRLAIFEHFGLTGDFGEKIIDMRGHHWESDGKSTVEWWEEGQDPEDYDAETGYDIYGESFWLTDDFMMCVLDDQGTVMCIFNTIDRVKDDDDDD